MLLKNLAQCWIFLSVLLHSAALGKFLPFRTIIAFALVSFSCACAKKEKTSTTAKTAAQAKLKLSNDTSALAVYLASDPSYSTPDKYTPTVFKTKILNISILQEEDTNKYPASMLYVTPECKSKTLEAQAENYSTDVSESHRITYEYIGMDDACTADSVTKFIDLAQGEEAVNTELNSQNLPVLPGKYKFISISFCYQNSDKKANVKFKTDGMSEEKELLKPGTCGVTSVEMNPPLEITKDSVVNVTLNYDLSNLFLDYGSGYNYTPVTDWTSSNVDCYVSDDSSVRRCINKELFNITASVSAQ